VSERSETYRLSAMGSVKVTPRARTIRSTISPTAGAVSSLKSMSAASLRVRW